MGKQFRKHLTFQAGEISPRYFGRSDTEIYNAGLEIAFNVFVDQRGGVRKRAGLLHEAQIDANNARVFTLQASPNRFYTIVVYHLTMLLIAPGAKIATDNLLLNGSFLQFGANWLTQVSPIASTINFNLGECVMTPTQDIKELVVNSKFELDGIGWTERVSDNQSTVVFGLNHVVLTPRQQNNRFAGIAQPINTTLVGVQHTLNLDVPLYNPNLRIRVGTFEGDGSLIDVVITASFPILFTPATGTFWITIDCEFPAENAVINSISIIEPSNSFVQISQEATVTALPADQHGLIVGQNTRARLHV